MSNLQQLELSKIRIDGDTQSRVELNHETVEDYSDAMADGAQFPPVTVFFDGVSYWLADGFHRYFGADHAGIEHIEAEVKTGTKLDAQLFSFGVNASHGLRRTNADKRKAVIGALKHPVSSKWSDNQIAKHCGVSPTTVGAVRASLSNLDSDTPIQRTYTTKHGTTAVMNTANIGRSQPAPQPTPAAQVATAAVAVSKPAPAPKEPTLAEQVRQETGADEFDPDSLEFRLRETSEALVDVAEENQRLLDENAALKANGTTEEQEAAAALIAEMREQLRVMGLELDAVKVSRDVYMNENAQLKKQIKFYQRKLKESEA